MADPIAAMLVDEVERIAREAGALALESWRGDFKRWEKAPGNPVCEVDLAVDELLRRRLSALLPEAGWLSEETEDDIDRLGRDRVWVVDPIDGTRDYIRGRTGWAVSVALVKAGRPVLAALHAPALDQTWCATLGGGAYRNNVRALASDRTELAGARVPSDGLSRADRDLMALAKPNSIALRIAMVAAGEADLFVTQRWGNEWDIGAAALIATEAGAWVSDAHGGALAFNKPDPRMWGLLACAPELRRAAQMRFAPASVV